MTDAASKAAATDENVASATDAPPYQLARSLRRREEILRVVLEMLRSGGVASVTTDAVAAEAGTSKATIYRHWRDKTAMVIAAADLEVSAPDVPDLGSLHAELSHLLRGRLTTYLTPGNDKLWAGLIGASSEDDAFSEQLDTWLQAQMAATAQIIERGISRGELRPDVSVSALATIVGGPLIFRLTMQASEPDETLVDTLVECVVNGLRPRAH